MNIDEVWKMLDEKGLTMAEKMQTKRAFQLLYENQLPHITSARHGGFNPTLEGFPSWNTETEQEINLANAMFLLQKGSGKEFREDKFRMVFQMVLTLLDIESDWRF